MENLNSPEKIHMPEIVIEKDEAGDISMLEEHIFRDRPAYSRMILNYHKGLGALEASGELTQDRVTAYFSDIYKEKSEEIDKIIEGGRKLIEEKSVEILSALAEMMDYEWRETDKYKAVPTLLPYSPFHKHTFYYSICSPLFDNKPDDLLHISVHEISHFMLFQLLDDLQIYFNKKEIVGLLHLFKESLTGMQLSEPDMARLLDRSEYKGNIETRNVFIQESSNEPLVFQEFLRNKHSQMRAVGKNFAEFIKTMIDLLSPSAEEFALRYDMWNKFGKTILSNSELLEKYKKPIKV